MFAFLAPFFASITPGAVGAFFLRLGASLLFQTAARALFGANRGVGAQEIQRQLSLPTTRPPYRFVYGECRATGTPAGTPVRGKYIWGCWILNSRPSDLAVPTLFLDKREVTWTGDPSEFEGTPGEGDTGGDFGGAVADAAPFGGYVRFWIGRGSQTSPPRQLLEEAPWAEGGDEDLWLATDAWQGRTVIWMALDAGANDTRQERWPATPPLVEVEGKWSLVWDPRDEDQDPDDPSTWAWSDNHALCVLDAHLQNPMRQWRRAQMWIESFEAAADVSDETVALKSGGSEARYRCAGTLRFDEGELEDQINPLVLSGAANLVNAGGKRGLAPGAWQVPAVTIAEVLGPTMEVTDLVPGAELVNSLRVSYLSPERGYEMADLEPWEIPGALSEDGGYPAPQPLELPFCPSATQAMRVRSIEGQRMRRQTRMRADLPPEAFNLVSGATATLSLPAPFDAFDGIYEVQSIDPAADPLGEDAVALRLPAELVAHSADIYDWTPATDEEDVIVEPYDATRSGVALPGAISVTTGAAANLDTGGVVVPRVRFAFDPSTSEGVDAYEWEMRESGGYYREGGSIDAQVRDGSDQVFGYLEGAAGAVYDIRVRTVAAAGRSGWREITGVTPVVDLVLDLPVIGALAESPPGTVQIPVTLPNDPDVTAVEVFSGPTSDVEDAAQLGSTIHAAPNAALSVEETGLGSGVTRYYFARTRAPYAAASDWTAAATITTA